MKKARNSNIELMRIVLMLLIIAHHYVVNSTVMTLWTPEELTSKAVFLTLWGMWGKPAINAFVMVTGWFMCRSRLTWQKFARLLLQLYFWKISVWIFLCFVRADGVTLYAILTSMVSVIRDIDGGFEASFLVMYLMIPFLNRLINSLDRDAHLRLLALLIAVYTISTTFFVSVTAFSEVGWYCTLYLIASYLRIYEPAWSTNRTVVNRLFAVTIISCILSVIGMMAIGQTVSSAGMRPYWFVSDSGKILALVFGVTCFLWFKNLQLPSSNALNTIAATTFGVLLIHAHSDAMRNWLWQEIVNVPNSYRCCTLYQLIGWSVVVAFMVFGVCSALDLFRGRLIEPAVMSWLEPRVGTIEERFRNRQAGMTSSEDNAEVPARGPRSSS